MSKISHTLVTRLEKLKLTAKDILVFQVPIDKVVCERIDDEIRTLLAFLEYEGTYVILPDFVKLDHLTQETQKLLRAGFEKVQVTPEGVEVKKWTIPLSVLPSSAPS